ncbi:hypothetical protein FCV25MIE_17049 [Fagus crenata]
MPTSSHFTPSIPSPSSPFKTHSNLHFFTTIPSRIQRPNPTTNTVQMLFLPSVSGIRDTLTGGANNARESILAIRRGMLLFRQICNDSCTFTINV